MAHQQLDGKRIEANSNRALLTDLYELTMAAGYLQKQFEARATFELFVRHLPRQRNYLVAAGLEQALARISTEVTEEAAYRRDKTGAHAAPVSKPPGRA